VSIQTAAAAAVAAAIAAAVAATAAIAATAQEPLQEMIKEEMVTTYNTILRIARLMMHPASQEIVLLDPPLPQGKKMAATAARAHLHRFRPFPPQRGASPVA